MTEIKFQITNYDCPACGKLAKMATSKIPGVTNVEVDNQGAVILSSDREISQKEITAALQAVGKQASFN